MTDKTPVIFRIEDGEVIALFPTLPGTSDPNTMTFYARLGQHGSVHSDYYHMTRPAKLAEYTPLLKELVNIGYDDLRVISRQHPSHYTKRKAALRRAA